MINGHHTDMRLARCQRYEQLCSLAPEAFEGATAVLLDGGSVEFAKDVCDRKFQALLQGKFWG
jgi:hypothetical protein